MKPISNDVIEKQLGWRYATKLFDTTTKISVADWQTLEQALVMTPSSFGLQPWKFLVITDPATREKLRSASWHQSQIVDASHLVVFAIRKNLHVADIERHVARTAEVRGVHIDSLAKFHQAMVNTLSDPPFDINEWAARQVYIALGFFMATAAVMGIDTCPIEGFEPQKYDDILGLAEVGYSSCVVAAAGYRSHHDKYASVPKVRFKTEDVVTRI